MFFRQGWSDIDQLLQTMDACGIGKSVLLYPSSDAHLKMGGWSKVCEVYNEEIGKKVKAHPDRLIGGGIVPVDESTDAMLKEIERIKDLGLSCLTLASSYDGKFLSDEKFLPVLAKAEKVNLPIFVHAQIINPIGFDRVKDPLLMPVVEFLVDVTMCAGSLMMEGIFTKHSKLKFVFAHFAGVMPFVFDRLDATYSMLRGRDFVKDLGSLPSEIMKNIYVDTSGVKSPTMIQMALETFGPSQVLWGSDYPAKRDLTQSIDVIKQLDADIQKDILSANSDKLFG